VDPIRASSLYRLHKQAGQTTAPDQRPVHHFMLATREPSTEDCPFTAQNRKLNEWQLLTNAPDLTNDRFVVVSGKSAFVVFVVDSGHCQ
jgi:hypothetical protein